MGYVVILNYSRLLDTIFKFVIDIEPFKVGLVI